MEDSSPLTSACVRCAQPATLQCPKCKGLSMPKSRSVYCSQDCFKADWPGHKDLHRSLFVLNSGRSRCASMPSWTWTGQLQPHRVGPPRDVPENIPRPDWALTGSPDAERRSEAQKAILLRSKKQVAKFKAACELGRDILDAAHRVIRPGVTTDEIDRVVHEYTIEHGAYPSPLNYHFFPRSVCTSVNEVVCHGIPDMRELQDGDIVNVDVSCYLNGVHGDLNETFLVGTVDEKSKKLVKVSASRFSCKL